jgi:hypothetical protein
MGKEVWQMLKKFKPHFWYGFLSFFLKKPGKKWGKNNIDFLT